MCSAMSGHPEASAHHGAAGGLGAPLASYDLAAVVRVYAGSDGDATRALYERLQQLGPDGTIAVNLLRAKKASERAKAYRGRFRGIAYDRKQWAMGNLVEALVDHADGLGLRWGWGTDHAQPVHRHVLYVELPTGQVSFHTGARSDGPDHHRPWDGRRGQSPDRIIRWVTRLLTAACGPSPEPAPAPLSEAVPCA